MNAKVAAKVAHYQAWPEAVIEETIAYLERHLAEVQSDLAAARKAQKNQRKEARGRTGKP